MGDNRPWRIGEQPDPGWAAPEPFSHWAPPVPAEPPEPQGSRASDRRPSRWLTVGIPLLTLALIIGVVAALGGFGKRNDRLITVSAGQVITTGPISYSFDRATSRKKDSLGDAVTEVVVYGHAQTSGDESMAPSANQFVGRDDVDKTVENPQNVVIGTAESYATGSSLTPGLPPVDFRVEFEFPATWQPSATFRIGVANLQFENLSFGGQDPHYEPDASLIYQVRMPLAVLAAAK